MHKHALPLVGLLLAIFTSTQALAWSHAGRFGGSASGGDGSWNAENRNGATASGGGGSWNASNNFGGSASGGGGSWNATSGNGGTASGSYGHWNATGENGGTAYGYRAPAYGTNYYHSPTVVNHYSAGCYDCGYNNGITPAGAAVAGAVVGATAANAANQDAYYNNDYYDNGNAYGAGYAAGQASNAAPLYGASITSLPPGCSMNASQSGTFYQCGATWYKPNYGANGVYYTVVPPP